MDRYQMNGEICHTPRLSPPRRHQKQIQLKHRPKLPGPLLAPVPQMDDKPTVFSLSSYIMLTLSHFSLWQSEPWD